MLIRGAAAIRAMVERAFGPRRAMAPSEQGPSPARDPVEEAGNESFPASDPPSWTLGEDRR